MCHHLPTHLLAHMLLATAQSQTKKAKEPPSQYTTTQQKWTCWPRVSDCAKRKFNPLLGKKALGILIKNGAVLSGGQSPGIIFVGFIKMAENGL